LGRWRKSRGNDMLNEMYASNLVPVGDVANANMEAIYHNRSLYAYVIETSQPKMDAIGAEMDKNIQRMDTLINKYKKTDLTPREVDLLKQSDAAWPTYLAAAKKVMAASYADRNDEAMRMWREEGETAILRYDDLRADIRDYNTEMGRKA